MIDKLTPAQVAAMPLTVAKWIGIGTCTDPADRPRAEAAVYGMYEQANLVRPELVWCDSPMDMAQNFCDRLNGPGASNAKLAEARREVASRSVYGQHEAGWLAMHWFFRHECGLVEETEPLVHLWELAQSCGWILPRENICFLSERHNVCKLNDDGVIHAENGPAIAYPDGFEIFAFNGVVLPRRWIMDKENVDPAEILAEGNVEKRAAGAAAIGWPRMLGQLRHEVVDKGPNADWGDLLRIWMPDLPEPALALKAECPRNGTILEFVPDMGHTIDGREFPVTTVRAAQAARVMMHPDEYTHPERRT